MTPHAVSLSIFPNPNSHFCTIPSHLQHSPTSSFIKSVPFFHRSGFFFVYIATCPFILAPIHLINFARELCPQTIPRTAPLQNRAERRMSPICLDRLVQSSHWLYTGTSHCLDRLDHTARRR